MGEKLYVLSGSADEVGEKLQESYDRVLDSTRKWAEILSFDPDPQTGMTPKMLFGVKINPNYTVTVVMVLSTELQYSYFTH